VTRVGDVIMETKACNLSYLKSAAGTFLLNNVRKVGELVLFRTCVSFPLNTTSRDVIIRWTMVVDQTTGKRLAVGTEIQYYPFRQHV